MAIKYVPYFPEPINGQALLDNFPRILKYKGNLDVKEKIKRGMPLYEVETTEVVGNNSDNMLIRGECLCLSEVNVCLHVLTLKIMI